MTDFTMEELRSLPASDRAVMRLTIVEAFVLADSTEAWCALVNAFDTLEQPAAHAISAATLVRQIRSSTDDGRRALADPFVTAIVESNGERAGQLLLAAYRLALEEALMRTHPVWEELS